MSDGEGSISKTRFRDIYLPKYQANPGAPPVSKNDAIGILPIRQLD